MASAPSSERLEALTHERGHNTDLRPRSMCPDCGDDLQPGQRLCARSFARLSPPERRKLGKNRRADARR